MKKILFFLAAGILPFIISGCTTTDTAGWGTTAASGKDSYVEPTVPEGEIVALDGFEEGNYWQAAGDSWDKWGSHNLSLTAETTTDWFSEGTTAGIWEYDEANSSSSKQATFFCDALLETDWTDAKYLIAKVNNIESFPITLQVSVQCTDGWTWTQTKTCPVPTGEHLVVFDLIRGTSDGGGSPTSGLVGADDVKRGMINVVGEHPAGSLYIDDIRLIK